MVEERRLGAWGDGASCADEGLGLRSGNSGVSGGADKGEEFAGDRLSSLTGEGGVGLRASDASNGEPALTMKYVRT